MSRDSTTSEVERALQQENVERLRAAYEMFNISKRFEPASLTEDVEFRQPEETGDVVYRGRDGVARGIQTLVEVFDGFQNPRGSFRRETRSSCSCA